MNAIANLLFTTTFHQIRRKTLGIWAAGSRLSLRFAHARKPPQSWCTGKDSNLRTSLGGTDLQSVGFNHSPTCANSAVSVEQRALSNPGSLVAHCSQLEALSDTPQPSFAVFATDPSISLGTPARGSNAAQAPQHLGDQKRA